MSRLGAGLQLTARVESSAPMDPVPRLAKDPLVPQAGPVAVLSDVELLKLDLEAKKVQLQIQQVELEKMKVDRAQSTRRCFNCRDEYKKGDISKHGSYKGIREDMYRIFLGASDYCLPCIMKEGARYICDKPRQNAGDGAKKLFFEETHHHEGAGDDEHFIPRYKMIKTDNGPSLVLGGCVSVREKELLDKADSDRKVREVTMKFEEKQAINSIKLKAIEDATSTAEALVELKKRKTSAMALMPVARSKKKRAAGQHPILNTPAFVDDEAAEGA